MADLNARIKPKKSSTAGEVPQAEDLEVSEIAVNTADGKLFTKHTDNSIKEISGGGAVDSVNGQTGVVSLGVQDMNDYKDAPVPQTAGYLWNDYLNSNQLWDYATAGKYQIVLSAGSTDWALKICSVDSSSTDRDADWLTVQIGDELTLSEDGNTWYTFVVGVISRYDSTTSPSYVNPVYSIGLDEVSVGVPDMAAWTTGFYTDPTYDPSVLTAPSNGQTLTWDAIDGSWRPADAAGGGAVTTLDNVGDVQYYVPPGSYDGLTDSTGSTSSASLTTSGQWFVSTNPAYFNFHQDQSTEMSLLQTGDEVTFEAYGLSHTTTLTTSPVAGSGVVWYFQVSPTFPAAWKGPTLPAGQALKVINNTRFPNTTPDDPLDKQALIWNGTDSEWQPTSTIQSVNGRIGDAVIGVDELDDYAGWLKYNVISSGSLLPDAGEAIINHASGWDFYLNTTDADGTSDGGGLGTLANGDPGQIKLNDGTLVDVTVNSTGNNTGSRLTVNFIDDSFLSSVSDGDVIYIQFTGKAYGLSAADGQVLTWVDANSQWEPADAPADAVSSVNGQTGVVSLVLSDLSDVGTATGGTPFRYNNEVAGSASVVTDGDWVYTSGIIVFDHIDADGQDATTGLYNQLSATGNPSSGSIWVSTDGVTFTEEVYTATFNFGDTDTRYGIATATSYSGSGEIWIAATEPTTQASDGQVLTWVDANSRWEPADAASGGGTTLPSGTADGEALIWENGAWAVGPVIGGVDYTLGAATTNSTPPTGFSVWGDTWNTGVSGITYSNNDRTVTYSSGDVAAYSATAKSTGKWYTELSLVGVDTNMLVGFATSNTAGLPGTVGTGGFGIRQGGSSFDDAGVTVNAGYNNAWGYSNYVMFAIDFDAKLIWFGVNGTWQNSGDPAAGTGHVFSAWTGTPTWYLGFRLLSSGDSGTWVPSSASSVIIPAADSIRILLGIGEYADDAAAGTGGVASGALYYNTTSNDYRLKT